MIKAVIDTNVIISGFFWSGPPKAVVEKMGYDFQAYATPEIIREYEEIFQRYATKAKINTEPMFHYVLQHVMVLPAAHLAEQICEDPDDDKFIACAYACSGDYIVTGDKLLLKAGPASNIEIVPPAKFLRLIKAR